MRVVVTQGGSPKKMGPPDRKANKNPSEERAIKKRNRSFFKKGTIDTDAVLASGPVDEESIKPEEPVTPSEEGMNDTQIPAGTLTVFTPPVTSEEVEEPEGITPPEPSVLPSEERVEGSEESDTPMDSTTTMTWKSELEKSPGVATESVVTSGAGEKVVEESEESATVPEAPVHRQASFTSKADKKSKAAAILTAPDADDEDEDDEDDDGTDDKDTASKAARKLRRKGKSSMKKGKKAKKDAAEDKETEIDKPDESEEKPDGKGGRFRGKKAKVAAAKMVANDSDDDTEADEDDGNDEDLQEAKAPGTSVVSLLLSLLYLTGAGAVCFFLGMKGGEVFYQQVLSRILGG